MFICNNPTDALALAKRILWLAYNASVPIGMGWLQERPDVTEESLWKGYGGNGRPGRAVHEAYVDYGYGRMMKVGVIVGRTDGGNPLAVEITNDGTPRGDYQSFARRYPTYADLLNAAVAELGLTSVPA